MLTKFIAGIAHVIWKDGRRKKALYVLVFFSFSLPIAAISVYHVVSVDRDVTERALRQRQYLATSTATALEEKLDSISNFVTLFADHPQIRYLASQKKWNEVIDYAELFSVLDNQSFIEGIFFTDPQGKGEGSIPLTPGLVGQDFSFRDWYGGVVRTGRVYLSEAYQRMSEPQYNIVAIAAPIIGDNGLLAGIVGFQMRLEHFANWAKAINTNSHGLISIVDQSGRIVSYPQSSSLGGVIVDFPDPLIANNLNKRETGANVIFNSLEKEKQVIAFAPITGYGWGLVVQQNTTDAFAQRTKSRLAHGIALGLLLVWGLFLIYLMLKAVEHSQDHRKT